MKIGDKVSVFRIGMHSAYVSREISKAHVMKQPKRFCVEGTIKKNLGSGWSPVDYTHKDRDNDPLFAVEIVGGEFLCYQSEMVAK